MAQQPVGDAVVDGGVQSVIQKQDLHRAARRGVVALIGANIFYQMHGFLLNGTKTENPPPDRIKRRVKTRGSTLISYFSLDAAYTGSPLAHECTSPALRRSPLTAGGGDSLTRPAGYSFRSTRYAVFRRAHHITRAAQCQDASFFGSRICQFFTKYSTPE